MARINIEDRWWGDVRRSALIRKLNSEALADGAAVSLWRTGMQYWKDGSEAIPKGSFEMLPYASELLQCNLAELTPEGAVYVRGARSQFDWIKKMQEAGRMGGKLSAAKRRLQNGTAQPGKRRSVPEPTPKLPFEAPEAFPKGSFEASKPLAPSPALSPFQKKQKQKQKTKNNIAGIRLDYPREFDEIWILYGRKGDKKASYVVYRDLDMSSHDSSSLEVAIKNYQSRNTEIRFRKDLERFLKTDWREWLVPPEKLNGTHPATQKRLDTFQEWFEDEKVREATEV